MQNNLHIRQFCQEGPFIDGAPLFKKSGGKFVFIDPNRLLDNGACRMLEKIATALNASNFAEAAIRFAHIRQLIEAQITATCIKANFDPSQPRNADGEWSEITSDKVAMTDSNGTPSVGYCKIVKQLCIVEATDMLPTGDYGFKFFRALNACMDRHGCLGVA